MIEIELDNFDAERPEQHSVNEAIAMLASYVARCMRLGRVDPVLVEDRLTGNRGRTGSAWIEP